MFRQLAGILSTAGAVAHEGTHYATARVVTDDAQWAVEVDGGRAQARWPPMESRVMRFLAHLAPTLLGMLLLGGWYYIDPQLTGLLLIPKIVIECSIAIIAMPSEGDLAGAFGRQDVQREA